MLSAILARLQAECPSFEAIAQAPGGDTITTVDATTASAALKTLLEAAVGAAYPLNVPEGAAPAPVDSIYMLASAQPVELAGVRLVTNVRFVVTLRAADYGQLLTGLAALEAQVVASAHAIAITDAAFDFDESRHHYLADIELNFSVPAVSGGNNWPALLVDVESLTGRASLYDNATRQRVDRAIGFTVLSATDNTSTLRAELQAALLGWQESPQHFEFEFQSGAPVALPGGLYAWRDTYQDGYLITA